MNGNGAVRLLSILLNANITLTIFYTSGLASNIGSYTQIPYILSGFFAGSVLFPSLATFFRTKRQVQLSFLSVPLSFIAIALYLHYTLVVPEAQMTILSIISTAGELFVTSAAAYRRWGFWSRVSSGFAGMLVLLLLLAEYALFYDTMLPIIILFVYLLIAILIPITHSLTEGGSAFA